MIDTTSADELDLVPAFYQRLHHAFETSKATALRLDDGPRSYVELFEAMRRLNDFLARFTRQTIAVYGGKTLEGYAAIYATILSGNCWMPLDPGLPPQRLIAMAEAAHAAVILYVEPMPVELDQWAEAHDVLMADGRILVAEREGIDFDLAKIDPKANAYIMFTSGSSGTPKGVPMTHVNYLTFVESALHILPLEPGDVFSDYHEFGFDLSIVYLFTFPFVAGSLAPATSAADRFLPLNHIRRHGVSVLVSVPALLSRLMSYSKGRDIHFPVRVLFFAGEPFRIDQLQFCFDRLKREIIFNFYGLTETGVENFYHACAREDVVTYSRRGLVPIGVPLPGNRARLSDDGELMLSGPPVMFRYLNDPDRSRFVNIDSTEWFRTGDRAVFEDGVYFCLGRFDSQVKISGFRVELMEIEHHLRGIAGVNEAVCFVSQATGRDYLVAALQGSVLPSAELAREILAVRLPEYMIPREFLMVDALPLTSSGKVDRKAVRATYEESQ